MKDFNSVKMICAQLYERYVNDPTYKTKNLVNDWPTDYGPLWHDLLNDLIENVNQITAVKGDGHNSNDPVVLADLFLLRSNVSETNFFSLRNQILHLIDTDKKFNKQFNSVEEFNSVLEHSLTN